MLLNFYIICSLVVNFHKSLLLKVNGIFTTGLLLPYKIIYEMLHHSELLFQFFAASTF